MLDKNGSEEDLLQIKFIIARYFTNEAIRKATQHIQTT